MGAVEIVIIVLATLVVVGSIVVYAVRKIKGKPTGGCAGCPYAKDCKHGCCEGSKSGSGRAQSVDTPDKN